MFVLRGGGPRSCFETFVELHVYWLIHGAFEQSEHRSLEPENPNGVGGKFGVTVLKLAFFKKK